MFKHADVKPRPINTAKPTIVTIYPIAGRQLFFRVPERVCRECDLTTRAVKGVVEEMGNPPEIQIRVKPWLNYLP